jgi:hypothetical protein
MIKRLRNLKAPEIRLLIAVCLCAVFFLASEKKGEVCGGTPAAEGGVITVVNNTEFRYRFKATGPEVLDFDVSWWNTTNSGYIEPGKYTWTAVATSPWPEAERDIKEAKKFHGVAEVKKGGNRVVTLDPY